MLKRPVKGLLSFLLVQGLTVASILPSAVNAQQIQAGRIVFPDGSTLPVKLDLAVQGLSSKAAVRAATTGNITLSGLQTIDGVALAAGDRVLVKAQSSDPGNGIYVASSGAWARANDMDTWSEAAGAFVFVTSGTINKSTGWTNTSAATGTIGTTPMPWVQFSGAGTYTAGTGLALTGGQFSLTAPVSIANGGTGATSAAGARTALGVEPTIPTGTALQYVRGDKTVQTLDKTVVGLSNVDNTSDLSKPVSTAQATADTLRVLKSGDAMTGTLTVPTLVNTGTTILGPNEGIAGTGGASVILRGAEPTGTDIAGSTLAIRSGRGTGAGAPGTITFQTPNAGASGTTQQTQTTRLTISSTGIAATVPLTIPTATSGDVSTTAASTAFVNRTRGVYRYSLDANLSNYTVGPSEVKISGWTAVHNFGLGTTGWVSDDVVWITNTTAFTATIRDAASGTTIGTVAGGKRGGFDYTVGTGWALLWAQP